MTRRPPPSPTPAPAPADRPADPSTDPWAPLRAATPARIGLGRRGDAIPLDAHLAFQAAHAQARDTVWRAVDFAALAQALAPAPVIRVSSRAVDRASFLRRPDLGRRLDADSAERLTPGNWDLVFVIADGLSADAVTAHAAPLINACRPHFADWRIGPLVLAEQGRVALGDEIGQRLGATLVALLIGERPGLSVADSLGIYLTFAPQIGRKDAERNCISNIHPAGLSYAEAAAKLAWLAHEARRRGLTGVGLKEDAGGGPRLPSR